MSCDSPEAIDSLLIYIYSGIYDVGVAPKKGDKVGWIMRIARHAEMCVLGDKYDVASLKQEAMSRVKNAAKNNL